MINLLAFSIFIFCWIGYTWFARRRAKNTDCLARSLHQHRIHWMREVITREIRVGDASLISNLERNFAFFASTTLLILAGVLTLFAQVGRLESVVSSIPYAELAETSMVQIKLGLLAFIFILSFFQFTWSLRQYGFLNVMIGAAPIDTSGLNENLRAYAKQMAIVQDQAAHACNYGLRSYYFSIAAMCWFYHPFLFIFASIFVVYTLYYREFKSKAVRAITAGHILIEKERALRFPHP